MNAKPMTKLTTGQLRAKAATHLRQGGHTLAEIAEALNVSKTQVVRMTTPVPGSDEARCAALLALFPKKFNR